MMMTPTPSVSYDKSKAAIRYWLQGRGYNDALRAMNIAERYHSGTRKNGDPEFSHQVAQAHILYALEPHLIEKELGFVTVFLHDTVEDYGTPEDAGDLPPFTLADVRKNFGTRSEALINRMSKVVDGMKKPNGSYYAALAQDPTASLAKGIDRIHNQQYMHGAFTVEKRHLYIEETNTFVIPMLKAARRNFPEQLPAYEMIKIMLYSQISLIHAMEPPSQEDLTLTP